MRSTRLERAKMKSLACIERIKEIHRSVIRQYGYEHEAGLEDAIYSEAGLQRICDRADYVSSKFEFAAIALETIAVFHPFVDGNKRTALAVALYILNDAGYTLPDDLDTYTFVRDVSMGMINVEEIEVWLRDNVITLRAF